MSEHLTTASWDNAERDATIVVSVVIPCRNEEHFIGLCLDSMIASDFPKERLEVLVVDGMSNDGTREVLARYMAQHPFIKVLDNPQKITPSAFNIGIRHARGELVMIMSAHSTIDQDMITKCVAYSEKYQAENVGGSWQVVPRDDSFVARAITQVLSHPFGAGNARYRIQHDGEPEWVDTAAYGCYRRSVFQQIGLFNEQLVRSQDIEFNLRMQKAGGRTLLIPDMVIRYYTRSDVKSFWKHNWINGVWVILPFAYSEVMPVAWRHLVPLAFVASVLGSAVLGLFSTPFLWLCVAIISMYGLVSLAASLHLAWRERDWRLLVVEPYIFGLLHVGFGLGSLWGVMKLLGTPEFWKKIVATRVRHEAAIEADKEVRGPLRGD